MATKIPAVRIAPTEMGQYVVTCDKCPLRSIRTTREGADLLAHGHQGRCGGAR